jgi:hypothetical protein
MSVEIGFMRVGRKRHVTVHRQSAEARATSAVTLYIEKHGSDDATRASGRRVLKECR